MGSGGQVYKSIIYFKKVLLKEVPIITLIQLLINTIPSTPVWEVAAKVILSSLNIYSLNIGCICITGCKHESDSVWN